MIIGAVKSNEARIRLTVRGRRGREQEVEGVIDSGYTGTLTLPPALVDEADADPLVGMRLLKGHELKMQVRYRGKVTIKRLPRRSGSS